MLGISATQRTGLQDEQIIFQIEAVRAEKQTLQNRAFEGMRSRMVRCVCAH